MGSHHRPARACRQGAGVAWFPYPLAVCAVPCVPLMLGDRLTEAAVVIAAFGLGVSLSPLAWPTGSIATARSWSTTARSPRRTTASALLPDDGREGRGDESDYGVTVTVVLDALQLFVSFVSPTVFALSAHASRR